MEPLVTVQNLTKYYGRFAALCNISFGINEGEVVGLLGPNGAGKSTTLKILGGLIDATSGMVAIRGENIAYRHHLKHCSVAAMLENNPLPSHLKVGEFLRFRAAMKDVEDKNIRVHTEKIMRLTDIQRDICHREIGLLSKGMRQRVGLADALLGNPELVILDEPTIGLDPNQVIKFRQLIASQKGKRTFIISSHILPEIETLCDRFIIINSGCIVANGAMQELRKTFFKERIFAITIEGEPATIDRFRKQHAAFQLRDVFIDLNQNHHQIFIALPTQNVDLFWKTLLGESGWKLLSITEKTATLEEIFIQATAYTDREHTLWH
ncbi:MAG: ABC transporter ATP-binding protein [Puniceicoccales bacterium]|nr:ABC transporter ATP-binding protein [Puniceicoccales bacterium]